MNLKDLENISSKETTIFQVYTLTPLLMHGWQKISLDNSGKEKNEPIEGELRVQSIKGILRYWWRTFQFDITASKLFKKETAVFGGTGLDEKEARKSFVTIKTDCITDRKVFRVCPHSLEKKFKTPGINSNTKFNIELSVNKKNKKKLEKYKNYFLYLLMLGGFGQRSRRGAGAIQFEDFKWGTIKEYQNKLESILKTLNIESNFEFPEGSNYLLRLKNDNETKHPVLCNVWIGCSFDDAESAREKISDAGHIANPTGKPQFLGCTMNKREASPLHGTVRKIGNKYYPIISEVIPNGCEKQKLKGYIDARKKFLEHVGVVL